MTCGRVTSKTTLVKLKNDVTRHVHNVHFIVSLSKADLLHGKPDSPRIPSTSRFVCETRAAEFRETNGTYLNPRPDACFLCDQSFVTPAVVMDTLKYTPVQHNRTENLNNRQSNEQQQ